MICDQCKGNGFVSEMVSERLHYRPEFQYLEGRLLKKNIIQCNKCNSEGEIKEEHDVKTIGRR